MSRSANTLQDPARRAPEIYSQDLEKIIGLRVISKTHRRKSTEKNKRVLNGEAQTLDEPGSLPETRIFEITPKLSRMDCESTDDKMRE